jgi:hypothetical protein
MTCAEFEQVLPDFLEGTKNCDLEAHLNSCPKCWELVSDLRAITEECKLLRASEDPSPRLWDSIETTLRREGLIRSSEPQRPFLVPTTRRRWAPAAWLTPVAAGLLLGIAFFVGRRIHEPVVEQNPLTRTVAPLSATDSEVVSSDQDDQVMAELAKDAPMVEASYQENLNDVNSYIKDLEHVLQTHPDDLDARQLLMEARQQKEMLYEMALDRSLP